MKKETTNPNNINLFLLKNKNGSVTALDINKIESYVINKPDELPFLIIYLKGNEKIEVSDFAQIESFLDKVDMVDFLSVYKEKKDLINE